MAYSDGSYRIRVGTWAVPAITSAYAVTAFPVQADQPANLKWYRPVDPSGAFSEVAEIVEALDGSRGGFGGYEFSWYFGPLTPLMVNHIRTTIFPGGLFSNAVTCMTWDRAYGWRTVNCLALWNDPARSAEPRGVQGYLNLRLDFINGKDAPLSGFDAGFDLGFGV